MRVGWQRKRDKLIFNIHIISYGRQNCIYSNFDCDRGEIYFGAVLAPTPTPTPTSLSYHAPYLIYRIAIARVELSHLA